MKQPVTWCGNWKRGQRRLKNFWMRNVSWRGEDRRNIVSTLKNVRQELKSNIPYLQKLFAEQMDKTVTEAKVEFETYRRTR